MFRFQRLANVVKPIFTDHSYDPAYMAGAFCTIMALKTIDDKMNHETGTTLTPAELINPLFPNLVTSGLWVGFFGTCGVPLYTAKRLIEFYPYRRRDY